MRMNSYVARTAKVGVQACTCGPRMEVICSWGRLVNDTSIVHRVYL